MSALGRLSHHVRLSVLVAQGGALIQYGIDRFRLDDASTEDLRRFQFSKAN
jgi:hypothetical protein